MLDAPRFLVPFDPKRVPHYFADVLIIGGGLAGMRAAMAVDPALSVLVVTKDTLRQSNSTYAQGGIAGVLDPADRFEDHIQDTLIAGGLLCDPEVVKMVVRDAPRRIDELIQWGTQFDKEAGELMLGREGGHSARRIVHALGDATGKEVMRAVIERARSESHIQIWQDTFTLDLLTTDGRCRGAISWNPHHGKTFIWAKQNRALHGRGRPGLSRDDESVRGHGRRACGRLARRSGTARYGVHAVSPHRVVYRRQQSQPDHRGDAR